MSVGMPGAAVGGLFYIVSALCMPLRESLYSVRGGRAGAGRWRVVARQAGIAAGIVAVTWLAGAALGLVVGPPAPEGHAETRAGAGLAMLTSGDLLRQVAILMSLVTLCVVLLGVQLLRLVVRRDRPMIGTAVAATTSPGAVSESERTPDLPPSTDGASEVGSAGDASDVVEEGVLCV